MTRRARKGLESVSDSSPESSEWSMWSVLADVEERAGERGRSAGVVMGGEGSGAARPKRPNFSPIPLNKPFITPAPLLSTLLTLEGTISTIQSSSDHCSRVAVEFGGSAKVGS